MSNNKIIEEIVKKIESFVSETSISEENKEFLNHLKKKLSETPNDETDKQKIDEIDEKDTDFLQKSLQFMISGKALTFSDEKKPISEFNLNKNNNTIQMILNLSRGFKDPSIEEEQQARIEEQSEDRTFICENHNERTTHYCKTCKRLICVYDIAPFDASEQGISTVFFVLSFY